MEHDSQPSRAGRRSPAVILLYIFLQSLGAGFATTPSILLFRDIKYKHCQDHAPIHIPEHDVCAEQTNHGPDVALFFGIAAILSLLVSGSYGRLLDMKGRKAVMTASGSLNACADIWLYFCVSVPFLSGNVYPAMLAAVFKGVGGGSLAVEAAHWSYIAVTARPERRSVFFILALLACWGSFALGVMTSSLLRIFEYPLSVSFMIAFCCWTWYSLAVAGLLRDEPAFLNDESRLSSWSLIAFLRSIVEPGQLIFHDPLLGLLAVSYGFAWLAIDAFDALTPLATRRYGIDSAVTGLSAVFLPLIRNLTAFCVLPLFVVFYKTHVKPSTLGNNVRTSETTPLLAHVNVNAAENAEPVDNISSVWEQEATIQWASFFAGSSALVLVILSKASSLFLIGSSLAGLSIPALPSVLSMVVLRVAPTKLGRVLMGFNMIQGATLVLPTIPRVLTFLGVSDNLTPLPFLLVATFLLGCGGLISLRVSVASPKSPIAKD